MTKLCPRGKAAAKRKFAVYPSAYANAYASKICAGKIKDPSGVKRKDFKGPKPAGKAEGGRIKKDKGAFETESKRQSQKKRENLLEDGSRCQTMDPMLTRQFEVYKVPVKSKPEQRQQPTLDELFMETVLYVQPNLVHGLAPEAVR